MQSVKSTGYALDRLENNDQPLPGSTSGLVFARPSAHLLFMDQWDSRGGHDCLCAETCPRSPVFESDDFRGATPGVWATGRDDGKPNGGRALQSTQWYQVSSERLHELPASRA